MNLCLRFLWIAISPIVFASLSFSAELVVDNPYAAAHAPSVIAMPDNSFKLVWFAGSREGAKDVVLLSADWDQGVLSKPRLIMSVEQQQRQQQRYVKKLGNPVLHQTQEGLRLTYVSVSLGGWATSQINLMASFDEGLTWQAPARLVTSPLWNLSTLVRHKGIPWDADQFLLPVYHELRQTHPEFLMFDQDFKIRKLLRPNNSLQGMQPTLSEVSFHNFWAYIRPYHGDTNIVRRLRFQDFEEFVIDDTNVTNPDAGLDVIQVRDAYWLMANNNGGDRKTLSLLGSNDGLTWKELFQVEQVTEGQVSYPQLAVSGDTLLLVYSRHKKQIVIHDFSVSELLGDQPVTFDSLAQKKVNSTVPIEQKSVQSSSTFSRWISGLYLSALILLAFPRWSIKTAALGLVVLTVMFELPIFPLQLSVSGVWFGLFSHPSILGVIYLLICLGRQNGMFSSLRAARKPMMTLIFVLGLMLYAGLLGFLPRSIYSVGYEGWPIGLVLCVSLITFHRFKHFTLLLWLTTFLWFLGVLESDNLFDYWIDTWTWLFIIISFIASSFASLRKRVQAL